MERRTKTCVPIPGGFILTHTQMCMGQNPNRTPSEHPNPHFGLKWVVNSPTPKWDAKTVLTHSQIGLLRLELGWDGAHPQLHQGGAPAAAARGRAAVAAVEAQLLANVRSPSLGGGFPDPRKEGDVFCFNQPTNQPSSQPSTQPAS